MADTTISGLSEGLPNKSSAIIPYSDGSTTYKTSPSGIVAASPGSIIKVANSTYSAQQASTNTTWIDTGLSCSLTPISNSSKILIFASINGIYREYSEGATGVGLRLLRGDSQILYFETVGGYSNSMYVGVGGSSCSYLDSPSTSSLVTYKVQFRNQNSKGNVYVQTGWYSDSAASTMTLMEIAG